MVAGWRSWRAAWVAAAVAAAAVSGEAREGDAAPVPTAFPAASSSAATGDMTLACLVEGDPKDRPTYRASDATFHREFTVRVTLTFRAGQAKPDVEVLYSNADERLLDEVRRFVATYRLPCLPDGAPPVVARQDFSFVEESRPVVWMPVRSAHPGPDLTQCLRDTTTPAERNRHYPGNALKHGRDGAVLVQMRFTDPDGPPSLRNLYVGGGDAFAEAADAFATNYRLPCLPKGNLVEMRQIFKFDPGSGERYAFKDLSLVHYLGMVEQIKDIRQRFDFSTMGCPFVLKMKWYQPYAPNAVGEVGTANENRREFIEWLRSLALSMTDGQTRQLLGQPFTISVPCGTLDLTS